MWAVLCLEICLVALGAWAAVVLLYRWMLMPAAGEFAPLVLPMAGQPDQAEGRLRWAYWQARCGGRYGFLFVLDCGMDAETAQICQRFASAYGNIAIGNLARLEEMLQEKRAFATKGKL